MGFRAGCASRCRAIAAAYEQLFDERVRLVAEPGRAVVGDAAILVTGAGDPEASCWEASISGDGRRVGFVSSADDLVEGDGNTQQVHREDDGSPVAGEERRRHEHVHLACPHPKAAEL